MVKRLSKLWHRWGPAAQPLHTTGLAKSTDKKVLTASFSTTWASFSCFSKINNLIVPTHICIMFIFNVFSPLCLFLFQRELIAHESRDRWLMLCTYICPCVTTFQHQPSLHLPLDYIVFWTIYIYIYIFYL